MIHRIDPMTVVFQLEKELMISVPTWEDEYRRPFLVNGVSILEVLSDTINASNAGKENRKVNIVAFFNHSPNTGILWRSCDYSGLELDLCLLAELPPSPL